MRLKIKSNKVNKTLICVFIEIALMSISGKGYSSESYNAKFLNVDNPNYKNVDLSFIDKGIQSPGVYTVDVFLNGVYIDKRNIEFRIFKHDGGKSSLEPCFSYDDFKKYGISISGEYDGSECLFIHKTISNASADFDFSNQKLTLSVPQIMLSRKPNDFIDKSSVNDGISAFLLNYSVTGSNTSSKNEFGSDGNSIYANIRPGINLGPWRLRNYTTWSKNIDGGTEWDTVYTYAQRSIQKLNSLLTLGDSTSPNDIFDSIPFRGVQLASDDDMLPESMKGYAPIVRGIAKSNAKVIIRQNGYVIYENYVTPGAFEISDLYSTGGAGDLNVTIREVDGSEQNMIIPFASLPVLQRQGRLKYSVTGGQYRSYDNDVDDTAFFQGTASYGLSNLLTLYGGTQSAAGHYQSLTAGFGGNLASIGAVSTDFTESWSTKKGREKESGQSWRIRYNKNVQNYGTYFTIAAYRYSSSGFSTLSEVLDSYRSFDYYSYYDRKKNKAELSINQSLGNIAGSLTLSAMMEDYWGNQEKTNSFGLGYNNSWNAVSYSVNINRNTITTFGDDKKTENIYSLLVSVPLNRWLHNTWMNNSFSKGTNGNTTHNVGLNGTLLDDDNLSWGVQHGYTNNDVGHSGSLNANYKHTYGEFNTGYSYDNDFSRVNYGLSGGVIIHEDGVTLGQPLSETIALVKAHKAVGVSVNNQPGVKTDFRGYAIVPYVTPYRYNELSLNSENLDDDVELETTSKNVVPSKGAIVLSNYETKVGSKVLMRLLKNGEAVPFGATASILNEKSNQRSNIIGDEGKVYLTGIEKSGVLKVKWGNDKNSQCYVNYSLSENDKKSGIYVTSEKCI